MKIKLSQITSSLMRTSAKAVINTAELSSKAVCIVFAYQPKVPQKLRK